MVAKSSGYANLNGDVDEVALYKSLLPVSRLQAHYYAGIADAVAPTVSLSTPADGSTTGTTPSFSGLGGTTLGDASAVTVNVYAGATATGTPVQSSPPASPGTGRTRSTPHRLWRRAPTRLRPSRRMGAATSA